MTLLILNSARVVSTAADAQSVDNNTEQTPTPNKSAELLADAIGAVKDSDLPKAVQKLETLLKTDSKNREALLLLAKIKEEQAMEQTRPESSALFLQAADLARQVFALPKELSKHEKALFASVFYYEGATHAVGKKPEKALAALRDAAGLGFVDVDTLDTDDELDALRDRPDFQKLRGQIEEKALPIARQHAAELLSGHKPFPFGFELRNLDGKKVSLADFKGKVTIVDVWGTWCPPCRMEIPHFVKLYERYHDKGLEIVGVNYEREEDDAKAAELVRAFVKKNGVPYTCVLGDEKTEKLIPNFQGFPTTLFIGRDGTVRLKVVGYHSILDLDAIVGHLLNDVPEKLP
ncbi:MAG: redoxin domain-containing protein [Isosphaeraceae bacterium]|nr:redoxin domain-containing protein [Isosphaeraceae bacterium]